MREDLPRLLDALRERGADTALLIRKSQLNRRQKAALLELTEHPDFSGGLRESLAANLLEREQSHYDHILKCTELVSKLAPMLGLLGTLIPLGPGIIALGQGDTQTLSTSLLTAFDTTIAGLCAAAVCLVVTTLRKRWYGGYMARPSRPRGRAARAPLTATTPCRSRRRSWSKWTLPRARPTRAWKSSARSTTTPRRENTTL